MVSLMNGILGLNAALSSLKIIVELSWDVTNDFVHDPDW